MNDQVWVRALQLTDNARMNSGQIQPDATTVGIVAGTQVAPKPKESTRDPQRLFPQELVERIDYVV